ncbi:MAG: hypothetical protein OXC44_06510 [Proteobacteria bacterium]|nr:hypothetical protein [Pseudomonadota bacterium]
MSEIYNTLLKRSIHFLVYSFQHKLQHKLQHRLKHSLNKYSLNKDKLRRKTSKHLNTQAVAAVVTAAVTAYVVIAVITSSVVFAQNSPKMQGIHPSPVILKAKDHFRISNYPLESYRLIVNHNGKAVIIPFQIDEQDYTWGDFVLDTAVTDAPLIRSDGVFNGKDELSFMGEDVGSTELPKTWSFAKPDYLFRIDALVMEQPNDRKKPPTRSNTTHPKRGSVFVGIYLKADQRPPLSKRKYVTFDLKGASIKTASYEYQFNPLNYLVVRRVNLLSPSGKKEKFIEGSSLFLKADLKYFLTLRLNHSDIISTLDAYKVGPIRSIVKVSFQYTFLRLKFQMHMYTEVSFFANTVTLPTIMHNPLEGKRNLNPGSSFYYGFAMPFDMRKAQIRTNMPKYTKRRIFRLPKKVEPIYELLVSHNNFLMFVMIKPSIDMIKKNNEIEYYVESGDPMSIMQRNWDKPLPLGEAPVNLGVNLELSDFAAAGHDIDFQLLFENNASPQMQEALLSLHKWSYFSHFIGPELYKKQPPTPTPPKPSDDNPS